MVSRTIIFIALFAIIAAALLYFSGVLQGPQAVPFAQPVDFEKRQIVARFESQHGQDFFTHRDSFLRFEFRQPVGYEVLEGPVAGVYLRLQASTYVSSSEIIDLRILEGERFTAADFQEVLPDLKNNLGNATIFQTTINGVPAYLWDSDTISEFTGEKLLIKNAIFSPCTDVNGTVYTVFFTAAIPEGVAGDTQLVDYLFYSFKCTG